jgi:hypothetical protein
MSQDKTPTGHRTPSDNAPLRDADDIRNEIAQAESAAQWTVAGHLKTELLKAVRKS